MDIWLILMYAGIMAEQSILVLCQSTSKDFIKKNVLGAEVELAKSFSRRGKDSSHLLNVSTTEPWTALLGFDEARSFWAFSQTHILANNSIYRLEGNEFGSMKLRVVAKLPEMILVDGMVFVEVVEWRRILFLLVAYRRDLCKIYTATPSMKITERQKITNVGAKDGEFFTHANNLYLIVVSSKPEHHDMPSTIYRWTGTHFDIVQTFMTSGAVAVSTFPFKGSIIITVAQYPNDKPAIGSQVFRWSHNKLERMQFLPTNGPVALQYMEAYKESYLLVINDYEYSSLYWWTGREFTSWDNFYDVKGMTKITIGYMEDETLILIALKDKIQVYRLLESRLHRLTTVSLIDGEEILSMSLHPDENVKLVAISRKNGALSTSVFHLQLVKGPFGDSRQKMDPLLQCLLSLNDKLLSREALVKNLELELPKILSAKRAVVLKGKLVVNGLISITKAVLKTVKTAGHMNLSSTALKISNQLTSNEELIIEARKAISQLVMKSTPGHIKGKIYVTQDLFLTRSSMEDLTVKNVNGKIFDPSNMLRYSLDQKIPGTLTLNTLKTSKLDCKELNGIYLEDLLLNYGEQQVSGTHTVQELEVNNLQIKGKMMINDVKMNSLVIKGRKTVRGRKELHTLQANNLKLSFFRNEDVTNIGETLVAKSDGDYSLKGLKFHSKLIIESLNVTDLNEIQWDSFQAAVFLKGKNQFINGTVWFNGTLNIDDVSADYINKVSPAELMTCSTEQEITSVVNVKVLRATNITATICNNLDLANEIARMGQDNRINGFVQMLDVQVSNVTTERDAVWIGIPKPNEMRPSFVYEGPVFIDGNLKVDDVEVKGSGIQINGSHVDISQLKEEYLMANAEKVTTMMLHATNNLKIIGALLTNKVNGVDFADIVHIGSTKELHGINFANISTSYFEIDPPATVSGVDIAQLFKSTVMNQGDFLVKGSKNFIGGIVVDNLGTKWIDDFDMTLMVPLKEPELSLGNKMFDKIYIEGDITAGKVGQIDYVNNLNLSLVLLHAVRVDTPFELNSVELSTIKGDNIKVSTLNKIDFNGFVKSLDPKSNVIHIKEVIIDGEVAFSGPLSVGVLNDINICSYLSDVVSRKIGGNVKGKKKFFGNVIVKKSLQSESLNNIDMISLEKHHFSKTKPQVVVGYFEMKAVSLDNLEVEDINGEKVNAFFVKGSDPQIINGNMRLLDLYLDGDFEVSVLNNCNIKKVGEYLNGDLEIGHFKKLNVSKQITWSMENPLNSSLSHLFSNAVNSKYDIAIDGEVTFLVNAYTKYMTTVGSVNGVNLKFIAEDCTKKSDEVQVLLGQKLFISSVNTSRVEVTNNANIKWVNGVDMPFINQTLIRKTGFHEIEGHKTFLKGFETKNLWCEGKVNGISISNIVSVDDDILPAVEVQNLRVTENLNFLTVNSMNLSHFLEERITCDGLQEVDSDLVFNGNLILQGDTETTLINNLDPLAAVLLDSDLAQEIIGKKSFLQDILIDGNINVGLVNDKDLTEEYSLGLLGNEDVDIDGNVIFANGSVMNANLEVNSFVNGMDISEIYNNAMAIFQINTESEKSYLVKIQRLIEESFDLWDASANEFMYLDYGYKDGNKTSNSAHSLPLRNREAVAINVMDVDECSLPKHCLCMKQLKIRMFDDNFTLMPSNGSQRHFVVYDESGERGAELFSNTVSRDNECKQSKENLQNEYNKVVWMIKDDDTGELTSDFNVDAFTFEGYVTDVRSFTVDSDFYVVISIHYDAKKSSHNINSLVLKWTEGENEARVVQKIPTYGATTLETLYINSGIYLFIGNSYDSDLRTKDVNDEIYRFDEDKDKFILLRHVPSTGTNSAASLTIQGHSFIIKGQDFNAPVAIYKYSEEHDNFYFYQNLYFQGSALAVGVFYVGGGSMKDGFVAVADTGEKIHLFKYMHVEGFKQVWEQRQKGIQILKPFTYVNGEFMATATLTGINVMRIVVQGS